MRISFLVILLIVLVGCSSRMDNPTTTLLDTSCVTEYFRPWQLWGYYNLAFDASHTTCTVSPARYNQFHLNALKFLEAGPCTNCLKIVKAIPKGDGIIDVDIQITNPYDNLTYSGFDVKGIIMFNGSLRLMRPDSLSQMFPDITPVLINYWRVGDWELLNPDGLTLRWSPYWNPDGVYPIEKYWPGKYAKDISTSRINAYMNYFTDENRHLFRANQAVTRTFSIKTQPGPMTVGYAVEACWEPPLKMPVTDPILDFPSSANQDEPYFFKVTINDGKPVEDKWILGSPINGAIKLYSDQWNGDTVDTFTVWWIMPDTPPGTKLYGDGDYLLKKCSDLSDEYWCGADLSFLTFDTRPVGWYRTIFEVCDHYQGYTAWYDHAFTVTDFYFDPKN
jgi:hypothetical protein